MEQVINELSIQLKNLELIDECINDVKNALVDISKAYKREQKNIDEAYQRGLHEGNDIGYKDGVNDGRNEAWEVARKIAQQWEEDADSEHRVVIDDSIRVTLDSMTASEAIEKLKAYEEKQKADEDVKRGDILRNKTNGLTYIVTLASDYGYVLLGNDGNCATTCITNTFEKTGKHFDIDKILDEMKK